MPRSRLDNDFSTEEMRDNLYQYDTTYRAADFDCCVHAQATRDPEICIDYLSYILYSVSITTMVRNIRDICGIFSAGDSFFSVFSVEFNTRSHRKPRTEISRSHNFDLAWPHPTQQYSRARLFVFLGFEAIAAFRSVALSLL